MRFHFRKQLLFNGQVDFFYCGLLLSTASDASGAKSNMGQGLKRAHDMAISKTCTNLAGFITSHSSSTDCVLRTLEGSEKSLISYAGTTLLQKVILLALIFRHNFVVEAKA